MKLTHVLLGVATLGMVACGGSSGDTTPPPGGNTQTLATIRFTNASVALSAGSSTTLVPEALDATGRVIAGASGYTFTSGMTAIAEAKSDGLVLAISAGSSIITASLTRNGVTATATATVTVTGSLPVNANVAAGNDQTFAPATVVVGRNANVTFTTGTLTHNVTFRTAAGAPANIANNASTATARPFPTAGDFAYDCTLHAGMSGTVIVR